MRGIVKSLAIGTRSACIHLRYSFSRRGVAKRWGLIVDGWILLGFKDGVRIDG